MLDGDWLCAHVVSRGTADFAEDGLVHDKVMPHLTLCQCLAGRYQVRCPRGDAEVSAGNWFLALPGERWHITHRRGRRGPMRARWTLFAVAYASGLHFEAFWRLPVHIGGVAARRLMLAYDAIADCQAGDPVASLRQQQALTTCLGLICNAATPWSDWRERQAAMTRLRPVLRWIEAHLAAPMAPQGLARLQGVSTAHLHRLFSTYLHCTPMQHVKQVRLRRAAALLHDGDQSITAIADAVGFANPYHFSREFSRWAGVPPSTYRRTRFVR